MVNIKKGQYKIQQMAFMILAIFFFFILVGLFFVGFQSANARTGFANLQEEKALAALKVIADSTELSCSASEDWCIDADKLIAFGEQSALYADYWGVASIAVLSIFPNSNTGDLIYCPAPGCDYYILYDNGQQDIQTFSAYVNICTKIDRSHTHCEMGQLILGVKVNALQL
ncbi:MAG: hypothetical protein ACI83O_000789 [Patescibacteria group bacterium]|jgi:hypothetical protein